MVAFTSPGNPRPIQGWKELDNKVVDNVLANPKASGGARWNDVALWGAVTEQGGSDAAARTLITGVCKNAAVLTKDAREATDTDGKPRTGDVLLNWETEAILARRTGEWSTPYKVFSPNVLGRRGGQDRGQEGHPQGGGSLRQVSLHASRTGDLRRQWPWPGDRRGQAYARGRVPQVTCFRIGDLGGRPSFDRTRVGKRDVWDQIFSQTR